MANTSEIHSLQVDSVISKQRRPHLHSILLLNANERIVVHRIEVDRISSE